MMCLSPPTRRCARETRMRHFKSARSPCAPWTMNGSSQTMPQNLMVISIGMNGTPETAFDAGGGAGVLVPTGGGCPKTGLPAQLAAPCLHAQPRVSTISNQCFNNPARCSQIRSGCSHTMRIGAGQRRPNLGGGINITEVVKRRARFGTPAES